MRTTLKVSVLAASLLAATRAGAAGFALDVLDARATGMAAAVTAAIDDPSAAFFNPAGLAQGRRFDVQLGGTMIIPFFKVTPTGATETTTRAVPVVAPNLYASYGVADQVTLGLGVFTPFGLDINWPAGWAGRTIINSASLHAIYINPEVAVRLWDNRLRIGAGVQIVRSTVELDRDIRVVPGADATLDVGGAGWGVGGNGGIQVDVVPKILVAGVAYRSPVHIEFTGDAHFGNVAPEFGQTLKDQKVTAAVTLPQQLNFGVAVLPVPELTLGLDIVYVGWQSFRSLFIDFEDPRLSSDEPKNFKHAWNYHLGGEYRFPSGLAFRAGLLIDPTPSPSDTVAPDLPDSDRINVGLGIGYRTGHYGVDIGYQSVFFRSRESSFVLLPARYGGHAQLFSLSLRYQR